MEKKNACQNNNEQTFRRTLRREKKRLEIFSINRLFFYENLDHIISLYNKKAKRLFLMSYDSFCIISEVPSTNIL